MCYHLKKNLGWETKELKPTNTILGEYGTTIFAVMSGLATEHGAINLGQGFPDVDGPADIRAVAEQVTHDGIPADDGIARTSPSGGRSQQDVL